MKLQASPWSQGQPAAAANIGHQEEHNDSNLTVTYINRPNIIFSKSGGASGTLWTSSGCEKKTTKNINDSVWAIVMDVVVWYVIRPFVKNEFYMVYVFSFWNSLRPTDTLTAHRTRHLSYANMNHEEPCWKYQRFTRSGQQIARHIFATNKTADHLKPLVSKGVDLKLATSMTDKTFRKLSYASDMHINDWVNYRNVRGIERQLDCAWGSTF